MPKVELKEIINPKKFIPVYKQRKNEHYEKSGPFAVELHWTSDCNYSCVHCSYSERREDRAFLSDNIINNLVKSLVKMGTQAVYLSGGGEPTLIKGWAEHAKFLIDNGIEVALITNGVNIKEESLDILRKFNYVALSVYSTDKQEYEVITGSKFFDQQFSLPKRVKQKKTNTVIGARCVLNNINFKNILNIYEKAISNGFDYIIFIPAVDYENNGVGLKKENSEWMLNYLTQKENFFDDKKTNIENLVEKKINHYKLKNYKDDFIFPQSECYAVELRTNAFINYDGGVYLCQPHIGNEKYSLGNINDNNLEKLWNNNRHLKIIKSLNDEFANGICQNCRSIGFNVAVNKFLNSKNYSKVETVKDKFI